MTDFTQSNRERLLLDDLFAKKSRVKYDNLYRSSTVTTSNPSLGTIEADASGRYGRWAREPFRAYKLAVLASNIPQLNTVLDVGAGNLLASSYFSKNGKTVDICDFETSPYLSDNAIAKSNIRKCYFGNFLHTNFPLSYDLVWASHVLEHQLDIDVFLRKIISLVADGGYLAIAVPPRKPFIVSGHVNLFNPGLLVYRLILAGLDCSRAKLFQYDGNICVLLQKREIVCPPLNYDLGDIETLAAFFPFEASEGFNGDLMYANLADEDLLFVYSD